MSKTVDNRVVSMEFDNAKFERNVQESLKTLNHLDQSLDGLVDSSKKFDGISFNDVAKQIESISNRFTLLGRIGQEVFNRLAGSVVSLGEKMIKNLSVGQIASGWDKYAEKTTAVQTIMSATGKDIEFVTEQLDKLNRFTDETSYNFTDMTSNIAKFTAQGISLDSAVDSMQGIALWAATAGQNAGAASRAMYNISQAMGAGSMKLIDWRSIQNANMVTQEFKEKAIEAAVAVGTLVEKNGEFVTSTGEDVVSIKNFEQTLASGWFSSDVMTKVFQEYDKFAKVIDEMSESTGISVTELIQLSDAQKKASKSFEHDLANAAEDAGISIEDLRKKVSALNAEELEFSRKAYISGQEAKTFGDAIGAAADAASTAWMNVFEVIFGNYEKSKKIWTDLANWLYDIFTEPVNSLKDGLVELMDGTFGTEDATLSLKSVMDKAGVSLLDYGDSAIAALKNQGLLTDDMIKAAGSVEAAVAKIKGPASKFKAVIDEILGDNTKQVESATDAFNRYVATAKDVIRGNWATGSKRKNLLTEAGMDADTVQDMVNKMSWGIKITEEDYKNLAATTNKWTDEQAAGLTKLQGAFEETAKEAETLDEKLEKMSGRELIFGREEDARGIVYNIFDTITALRDTVADAWSSVFDENKVEVIHKLLVEFNKFTRTVLDTVKNTDKLQRTLAGLFAVIDIGKQAVTAVVKGIIQIIDLFVPVGDGLMGCSATIGDILVKIDKWIKKNEVFTKAVNLVVKAISKVVNALYWLYDTVTQSAAFQAVANFIKTAIGGAIGVVTLGITQLINTFPKITKFIREFYRNNLKKYLENLGKAFQGIGANLKALFSFLGVGAKAVKDFFGIFLEYVKTRDYEKFIADLEARFADLRETVRNTVSDILSWYKKLDKGTVAAVLGIIAAISGFKGIAKIVDKFTSVRSAISGFFNTASSAIKEYTKGIKYNYVLKVAAAIAVLAASLISLSMVPADKLQAATISLGILSAIMGTIVVLVETLGKGGGEKAGAAVLFLAGAVLVLSIALQKLTQVNYDNIQQPLSMLLGLIGVMTVVGIVISRAAPKLSTGGLGLLAFAGSILMLCNALRKIQNESKTLQPETFVRLLAIASTLALLGVGMRSIKFGSAMGLLAFVVSLLLLQKLIKRLVNEKISKEELIEFGKVFLAAIGILAAVAGAMRLAGAAKSGIGLAATIIAVVLAIFAVTKVIKRLREIDPEDIKKSTIAIVALGLMFSVLIAAAGYGKQIDKMGVKALNTLIIGVLALCGAMLLLASVPEEQLQKSVLAIAEVMGALAVLILAMELPFSIAKKDVKFLDWMTMLTLIGGMAGLFIVVSKVVSKTDPQSLVAGCQAMGNVMVALGIALVAISKADFSKLKLKDIWKPVLVSLVMLIPVFAALWAINALHIEACLPTVISMGILLEALAGAIYIISKSKVNGSDIIKQATGLAIAAGSLVVIAGSLAILQALNISTEGLLPKVAALAILVEALAGAMLIISYARFDGTKEIFSKVASLTLLSLTLLPIAASLQTLSGINVEGIIPKVAAVSTLLIALAGVAVALSFIPKSASFVGMLKGVGIILVAIIGLAGVFALVGAACQEWPSLSGYLSTGASALGNALGTFIGALGKGIVEAASGIVDSLGPFVDKLKDLAATLGSLDKTGVQGVTAFTGLLLALAAVEFIGAVKNLTSLINPIKTLMDGLFGGSGTNDLARFAEAIRDYAETLTSVGIDKVETAAAVTKAIGDLLKVVPSEGGFLSLLTGDKSSGISNLSENLPEFATAVSDFVNGLAVDISMAQNATNVAKTVLSLLEYIPSEQGLWPAIIGTESGGMKNLTANLSGFAGAILTFILTLGRIDISMADNAYNAASKVISISDIVPKEQGIWPAITGSDSGGMKNLTENLPAFARAIADFCVNASAIPENGEASVDRFIGVLNKLNSDEFATEVSDQAATQATQSADKLGNAFETITGKFTSFKTKLSELNDGGFAAATSGVANTVTSFSTSLADIDTAGITSGLDSMSTTLGNFSTTSEDLSGVMQNFSAENMQNFTSGITTIPTSIGEMCDKSLNTLGAKKENFKKTGREMIDNFSTGITTKAQKASDSAKKVGKAAQDALRNATNGSYGGTSSKQLGRDFAQGFANGITEKLNAVSTAARNMALAANKEVKITIQSNSPAKVTKRLGGFFGLGFAVGIRNTISTVKLEAQNMANTAITAVDTARALTDQIIEQDANPVITPIIDMSEVTKQVSTLDNLGTVSAGLSRRTAGMIAKDLNVLPIQNQNGTSGESAAPTYQFNQYNNSPKALSRIDIYRQTKNLISMQKEATSV